MLPWHDDEHLFAVQSMKGLVTSCRCVSLQLEINTCALPLWQRPVCPASVCYSELHRDTHNWCTVCCYNQLIQVQFIFTEIYPSYWVMDEMIYILRLQIIFWRKIDLSTFYDLNLSNRVFCTYLKKIQSRHLFNADLVRNDKCFQGILFSWMYSNWGVTIY